jgi:hypothetical protein
MKNLHPKVNKTTIFLPPDILKAVKEKAKGAGVTLDTWLLFSLLRTLHDESFAMDLRLSDEYLDQQLDI